MTQPAANTYDDSEFLDDLDEWHQMVYSPRNPMYLKTHDAAKLVMSRKHGNDLMKFRYRVNRFDCIVSAISGQIPGLLSDRIARSNGGDGADIPEHLFLALLAWYRTVPDSEMKKMPHPDWLWVADEFDRLDAQFPPE